MKRGGWIAAAIAMTAAGAGLAQPTAQQPPQPQTPPQATSARPAAAPPPVSEEAPPVNVPTPQPMVVPPIGEKEVAPAPPEKTEEAAAPKAPDQPQRRPRYDVAILQVLDKVTAETLRFEAPVGKPIRYKTLVFTVRACEHTAPDEPIEDNIAYVEVLSQPRAEPGRPVLPAKQAFKGWIFASSPSLNAMEHPLYAAWVINCRAASPVSGPAAPAR